MISPTYLCVRCLIDQATHAVELAVEDPAVRLALMEEILGLLQRDFPGKIPAELGTLIHRTIRGKTGTDPYAALKEKSNRIASEVAIPLREKGLTLRSAVCAAIAGNAIDFGVDGSRNALETLDDELRQGLAVDHFDRFRQEVEQVRTILYLTDNCGEVVFDLLLVEQLLKMGKEVIVSPKAEPILNDATVVDLEGLGFSGLVPIVPHTVASIGLPLKEAPAEFRKVWDRADLVIAKGMGHYETLYGIRTGVVFLLKAKCLPVAESLGVGVGGHVLTF
ncbi:MAG: DUF89 family protein [Deltaproteobacteria bacterium]|nr:DUF89 family protein [Deltaproteobacteria bacterium]